MELIGIKVYFIILFHIKFVINSDPTQEVNSEESVGTALEDKKLERTNTFGIPILQCENNICSLYVGATIPFTSITLAGKIIVGYDVVTENTISGEGRLIYTNSKTDYKSTLGLKLSIGLEGVDELQVRLDIIWGKNETHFSIGGEIGTDLPALCAPILATEMFFKFCITIGEYKYFHEDRLIICLRAEIQFCEYRVFTLVYKCLGFSKQKVKAINQKLKKVTTFSKNQYDAAKKTLQSIPSFRQNSFRDDEGIIENEQTTEEKDDVNSIEN